MPSVLKDWVHHLPFRMQSVLMSALRGCDIARKDDDSKAITRSLRPILCNNADTSNTFMAERIPDAAKVKQFLWDMDSYPMHFIAHLMHAAEIVGYKHPEADIRRWWLGFYKDVVKGLHLNFETEAQLDVRLGRTPEEPDEESTKYELIQGKKPKTKTQKWDAGTGTSHGGRDREWSGGS